MNATYIKIENYTLNHGCPLSYRDVALLSEVLRGSDYEWYATAEGLYRRDLQDETADAEEYTVNDALLFVLDTLTELIIAEGKRDYPNLNYLFNLEDDLTHAYEIEKELHKLAVLNFEF